MNTLESIHATGQSLWTCGVSRKYIEDGTLQQYIKQFSITGVSICPFSVTTAISSSNVYDSDIASKIKGGLLGEELATELIVDDACYAADLLRHVYDKTDGVNGWATFPFGPLSRRDSKVLVETISRLFYRSSRPNLVISITATKDNISIIEDLVFAGVPINISLIYSKKQYEHIVGICLRGLERRSEAGLKLNIPIFISIYISQLASTLENNFPTYNSQTETISFARHIYRTMKRRHNSNEWERMYNLGAKPLRIVWSSVGAAEDSQSQRNIFNELIVPFTACSMPIPELESFLFSIPPQFSPLTENVLKSKEIGIPLSESTKADAITTTLQAQSAQLQVQKWLGLLEVIAHKSAGLSHNTI